MMVAYSNNLVAISESKRIDNPYQKEILHMNSIFLLLANILIVGLIQNFVEV
jgi:hypothetical protein